MRRDTALAARWPDHAALARYLGLIWSEHQSGKFRAQDTRLVKQGNKYLRYYLVEDAASIGCTIRRF